MTINDEILIVANQIANKGNKPTVALIKTKLNKKVPLPIIISTLKTWQHEPDFVSLPQEQKAIAEKANFSIETDIYTQELYEELADMKKEIIELKLLIKQLINQQKS